MSGISGIVWRGPPGRTFAGGASAALAISLGAALLSSVTMGAAAAAPRPRPVASSAAGQLLGVACGSSSSCAAVGTRSTGGSLIEQWNGSKWSVVSSPNPSGSTGTTLWGVDCTSAKSCLAVGSYNNSSHTATLPAAESWNGSKWSVVSVPAPSGAIRAVLEAISCASTTNCQAVGTSGNNTLAESWNGAKWTMVSSPSPVPSKPNVLRGVACPATTECWAGGYYFPVSEGGTLTEKWNGSKWSVVSTPSSKNGELNADACSGKSDCLAVGLSDQQFALGQVWNGSTWATATPAKPTGATGSALNGVSCPGGSACEAAGSYSTSSTTTPVGEGWTGTKWSVQTTPSISGSNYSVFQGVACTTASNCWAVGSSFASSQTVVIEHWNGKSWTVSAS